MSVEIVHVRNNKGPEIDKYCKKDHKKCTHEKSDVCFGCSVLSGDVNKPVLFESVEY